MATPGVPCCRAVLAGGPGAAGSIRAGAAAGHGARAAWLAEDGQAAAFAALVLGGLLVFLLWAAIGISSLVQARAALAAAVDAAALAARQATATVQATLAVRYATYRCGERPDGPGPVPRSILACAAAPGATTVRVSGTAFGAAGGGLFGPDPAWAAAAGCVGTVWRQPAGPGTWRICAGQVLVSAAVAPVGASALWEAAQAWLAAEAAVAGLSAARILSVQAGSGGQVTLVAQAVAAVPLFGRRTLRASATAWPGA